MRAGPEPEGDRGQGEHGPVGGRELLAAGGDPAELLQPVDQALADVALPVGGRSKRKRGRWPAGCGIAAPIYTGQLFAGRFYGPIAIGSAPYMSRDYNHWAKFRDSDLVRELVDGYGQETGNHIVTHTHYGERQTTSNKEIAKPDDMQEFKIRVPDAPLYKLFP